MNSSTQLSPPPGTLRNPTKRQLQALTPEALKTFKARGWEIRGPANLIKP